jgi:GTPase SAR1 family protein
MELVSLESVMEQEALGPNGGILFALDVLAVNLDWLKRKLDQLGEAYVLFDCPGQVELFTHHKAMRTIVESLQTWSYRVCDAAVFSHAKKITAVHLIDSSHCADPSKYLSVSLLSLSTMLHLELPHVNVLTKIDLLSQFMSDLGACTRTAPTSEHHSFAHVRTTADCA